MGEVLIDSGGTCNVLSEPTWNFLKQIGIRCESRQSATSPYAYGGKEPLPTPGTFKADVMLAVDETGCRADFVAVKGDGCTLLGRGTAMDLEILRVGPVQANSVSGGLDGDIRVEIQCFVQQRWAFKRLRVETAHWRFSEASSSAGTKNSVRVAGKGGQET